jgi:hypothetical protein
MPKEIIDAQKPLQQVTETPEREAPPSVRESIQAAIKTTSEDDDVSGEREPPQQTKKEKSPKKEAKKDDVSSDTKDDTVDEKEIKASDIKLASDDNDEEDAGDDDTNLETDDEKEVKAQAPKEKAPASLPKEVTANWDKLPSDVRAYIAKSHKELTDTKSAFGRREAQYREMDTVLAQYKPSIDQLGVTPAQTVDRLFQWMNALAGPRKKEALRQLANDFGIQLDTPQQSQEIVDDNQQQQTQYQRDPELDQTLQVVVNKLNGLEQQQIQVREQNAKNAVDTWAGLQPDGSYKNKPHLPLVRQVMHGLIASGSVPLIDGRIDLDGAYEAACYAHPEVRASLEQEKLEARKAKLLEKKKADEAAAAAAKKKNISIRPGAPARASSETTQKLNGPISVRDSIKNAIRDAANT